MGKKDCSGFVPLTNGGGFLGTYCCTCGEKESDHAAPLEWAALWGAMGASPASWVKTTEGMYWEMLGAVPPRDMGAGAFLVGEANHHNSNGQPVYACFRKVADEFEARYMTVTEFRQFKSIRSAEAA